MKTIDTKKSEFEQFKEVVKILRGEGGCPWDREQTHETLKPCLIEEAAEVICGINVLNETGNYENFKEELGDLLLQIVFHAQVASEEGLFDLEDVAKAAKEKMIRRHPHVFGDETAESSEEVLHNWELIKQAEKIGKEPQDEYLPAAFDESIGLINKAKERKGYK